MKCKWVFKTKFDGDGSPLKYKEILISKGYSQVHGIDYNETFAPVAKMDSIRLSSSYCNFEAMGGTSHGCKVFLYEWIYE